MREEAPSPAPISSFRVIYKMERECAWCLTEVMFQRGKHFFFLSNEAIPLTLRTARKS